MSYLLNISDQARDDLRKLKRDEPISFNKAKVLLEELQNHPKTGTGKPEPLSGDRSGQWSRRITLKHRLIYSIEESIVTVLVISAYGQYGDK